jgi:hypothetical protein
MAMTSRKSKLIFLTLLALALVIYTGNKLKTTPDLPKPYLLAYGLVFTMSCISFVRGAFSIGKS